MKAIKGNKEYLITESQIKGYQDRGFDIVGDDGELIAYGRGKKISYDEYVKLQSEKNSLVEQLNGLLKENEALKAEITEGNKTKASGKAKAGES